jgi:hypothetical protein
VLSRFDASFATTIPGRTSTSGSSARQIVTGDVSVGPLVDNELFHYYVEFCFDGGGVGFGGHGVWAVAVHFE